MPNCHARSLSKSPYCDSTPSQPQCKHKAFVNKPLALVYGGRLASSQTTACTSCGPCGVRNTVNCLLVSVVLGWCSGFPWGGLAFWVFVQLQHDSRLPIHVAIRALVFPVFPWPVHVALLATNHSDRLPRPVYIYIWLCIRVQRGVKTLVSKKRRFRSALSRQGQVTPFAAYSVKSPQTKTKSLHC